MNRSRISPERAEAARQRQAAFFARTGNQEPLRALFDYLPQHRFFIKSVSGHLLAANQFYVRRLNYASEEAIIGITDEEAHPPAVARAVKQDDLRIMRTKKPMLNHLEILFRDESSEREWGCTTKIALMADDGRVIGIIGISYPADPPEGSVAEGTTLLERVVAEIKQNHAQALKIYDLAGRVGLSPRKLNQIFQKVYRMGTQQFIINTRVQASVRTLINTRLTLGEVALEHGFSDQSAFTRQFGELMGQTPQEFRSSRSYQSDSTSADFIKTASNSFKKH